ncbi:hypothetical protein DMR21_07120 [Klebsiella variicola]|nr:hypothetical protein [Klebsiella variicola subsp. variicola]PXK20276.1 hypothetical protein DMR21_07120 [Klebsiella variicola]
MVETSCSAVPPVYRALLTVSVSRAVIAHFFAGIMCGSQHPDTCWRKKTALRRLNQRFQRDLHKVIAIDYLPGAGACADITVLIINNQDL